MIGILDYGMGNLRSVRNIFSTFGVKVFVSSEEKMLKKASILVVPGVGAFGQAMKNIKRLGLLEFIRDWIFSSKPYFGICLGMQLLFSESEEAGEEKGLEIFEGRVRRFSGNLKIPHMGWNSVRILNNCRIFSEIEDGSYFYFVHSYFVEPASREILCTLTTYGVEFASSIFYKNLFACQFHPEKSQRNGIRLVKNFLNLFLGDVSPGDYREGSRNI